MLMGTVVDMTLSSDQFALSETFDVVPDAEIETVRVAAHGPHGVMPFLRASASRLGRLDGALHNDTSTKGVTRLSADDGRAFYRIRWGPAVRQIIGIFVEADGSLVRANAQDGRWKLRVLFPDRKSVSETYQNWREHGITPSIRRVNGVSDLMDSSGINLSPCQHRTLVEAFETSYYDVPRGITLDGLAEELDISHQALSERLRRGHRNLIGATLCDSPAPTQYQSW